MASSSLVSRRDDEKSGKLQGDRMKEDRERSGRGSASKTIVRTAKVASRSNSQDSYVLPDIEDPLAGCYSESD